MSTKMKFTLMLSMMVSLTVLPVKAANDNNRADKLMLSLVGGALAGLVSPLSKTMTTVAGIIVFVGAAGQRFKIAGRHGDFMQIPPANAVDRLSYERYTAISWFGLGLALAHTVVYAARPLLDYAQTDD